MNIPRPQRVFLLNSCNSSLWNRVFLDPYFDSRIYFSTRFIESTRPQLFLDNKIPRPHFFERSKFRLDHIFTENAVNKAIHPTLSRIAAHPRVLHIVPLYIGLRLAFLCIFPLYLVSTTSRIFLYCFTILYTTYSIIRKWYIKNHYILYLVYMLNTIYLSGWFWS